MRQVQTKEAITEEKKEQLLEAVRDGVLTRTDIENEIERKETPYLLALREVRSTLQQVQ